MTLLWAAPLLMVQREDGERGCLGCARSFGSEPLCCSHLDGESEADGPSDSTASRHFMALAGSPPRCVYRDVFRISFLIYERGSSAGHSPPPTPSEGNL